MSAAQRDRHLHLHVISNDLVSDRLTTKKHYNSFKPNESYFLKLGAVEKMLGWTQKDIDREISVRERSHLAHLRQHSNYTADLTEATKRRKRCACAPIELSQVRRDQVDHANHEGASGGRVAQGGKGVKTGRRKEGGLTP